MASPTLALSAPWSSMPSSRRAMNAALNQTVSAELVDLHHPVERGREEVLAAPVRAKRRHGLRVRAQRLEDAPAGQQVPHGDGVR